MLEGTSPIAKGLKSTPCTHWDPMWHQFLTRMLHFPSTSLLVAWENSSGQPKALGPCTYVGGEAEKREREIPKPMELYHKITNKFLKEDRI